VQVWAVMTIFNKPIAYALFLSCSQLSHAYIPPPPLSANTYANGEAGQSYFSNYTIMETDSLIDISINIKNGRVLPGYVSYLGRGRDDMRGLRLRYNDHSRSDTIWGVNSWSAVVLNGNQSNTFRGEVEVYGSGSILTLFKGYNATAIQGDVYLHHGGGLSFWLGGDQIADSSTIRMDKGNINLAGDMGHISEKIHKIEILGDSLIRFSEYRSGFHHLFLDDLEIKYDAELWLVNWRWNADYLLVRKDSKHLDDALRKIRFKDHREPMASIREYNSEYWEIIPGFPEPATYGAVLGAVGTGLVFFRRCSRSISPQIHYLVRRRRRRARAAFAR